MASLSLIVTVRGFLAGSSVFRASLRARRKRCTSVSGGADSHALGPIFARFMDSESGSTKRTGPFDDPFRPVVTGLIRKSFRGDRPPTAQIRDNLPGIKGRAATSVIVGSNYTGDEGSQSDFGFIRDQGVATVSENLDIEPAH